eukprot:tig00001093_g6881.t1
MSYGGSYLAPAYGAGGYRDAALAPAAPTPSGAGNRLEGLVHKALALQSQLTSAELQRAPAVELSRIRADLDAVVREILGHNLELREENVQLKTQLAAEREAVERARMKIKEVEREVDRYAPSSRLSLGSNDIAELKRRIAELERRNATLENRGGVLDESRTRGEYAAIPGRMSAPPMGLDRVPPSGGLRQGLIVVRVLEARGLKDTDMVGKSDPYAVVKLGAKSKRTRTIRNNLNPVWNEEVQLDFKEGVDETELNIQIWDEDVGLPDDFLGQVTIPVQSLLTGIPIERWFALASKTGRKGEPGQLHAVVQYVSTAPGGVGSVGARGMPMGAAPRGMGQSNMREGLVVCRIMQARGLKDADTFGKSDPYTIVKLGAKSKRTKTIPNNLNPVWNEELALDFKEGVDETELVVQVFDEDRGMSDDFIGGFRISLQDLMHGQPLERWFSLSSMDGSRPFPGQVLAMFQFLPRTAGVGMNPAPNTAVGLGYGGAPGPYGGGLRQGVIVARVLEARGLKDADAFGKSDPYAVLKLGAKTKRTKTIPNNLNPVWNEELALDFKEGVDETELHLQIWDEDVGMRDDFLGQMRLPVQALIGGQPLDQWFPLASIDGRAPAQGQVHVVFQFIPGATAPQGAPNAYGQPAGGFAPRGMPAPFTAGGGLRQGVIVARVLEARGLKDADAFGKSDPYAVLKLGAKTKRTKTIPNNLNPVWNEELALDFKEGVDETELHLQIWDEDVGMRDDFLGQMRLPVQALIGGQPLDQWFPLASIDGRAPAQGQVHVVFQFIPGATAPQGAPNAYGQPAGGFAPRGMPAPFTAGGGLRQGVIVARVLEARGLKDADTFGKSDPYAVLKLGAKTKRTKTIPNNLNPVWNEELALDFKEGVDETELHLQIWDEDVGMRDDFLGQMRLPVQALIGGQPLDQWFPLASIDGRAPAQGQVHVVLQFIPGASASAFGAPTPQGPPGTNIGFNAPQPFAAGGLRQGTIVIRMLEARGLKDADTFGKSDPYAIVKLGAKTKRTKTVKGNTNPVWNEEFQIDFKEGVDETEMLVQIWDEDRWMTDDLLGQFRIPVQTLLTGAPIQRWFPLTALDGRTTAPGQVNCMVQYIPAGAGMAPNMAAPIGGAYQPSAYQPSAVPSYGAGAPPMTQSSSGRWLRF